MVERPIVAGEGASQESAEAWKKAVLRRSVLSGLNDLRHPTYIDIDEAAGRLGISGRYVYILLKRFRESDRLTTSLLPSRHRGAARLNHQVEGIVQQVLEKKFLTRQRRTAASVHRDIERLCTLEGLPAPSPNTVRRRIRQIDPIEMVAKREGPGAARRLQSAGGSSPVAIAPLSRIEMDHTPADILLVDEESRAEIGRPFITVAIDSYSRCVLGLVVTYDFVSSVSVALCLAQVVADKRPMLAALELDIEWEMAGVPSVLYVDNGADFHSEALRHGCEQHGIEIQFRPPGQPQYGGTVERLFRTLANDIHELPGTTFSNPTERGSYPSEAKSALTLKEFERWCYLTIAKYHGTMHRTLRQTPEARWSEGIEQLGPTRIVDNPEKFFLDFLPSTPRTLGRQGFQVDGIQYFSNALKPWIARRASMEKFKVRRDVRDISRIWVHDPADGTLLEVPSRSLNQRPISLWEHKRVVKEQRAKGHGQIRDVDLERIYAQRESLAASSESKTRGARRDRERTAGRSLQKYVGLVLPESSIELSIEPFDEVEDW